MPITSPIPRRIHCVDLLYQPETRSIAPLYQASIFAWTFCRSPSALSIALRSTRWTGGFCIRLRFERSVCKLMGVEAIWLSFAPSIGPRAAISIKASAKFRLGMYDGMLQPRVSAMGHFRGFREEYCPGYKL